MTIHDVICIADAIEILKEKNLTFDWIHSDVFKSGEKYHTKEPIYSPGIHQYFMQGNCDIGYYTERTNTLHIHDQPRPWDEKELKLHNL